MSHLRKHFWYSCLMLTAFSHMHGLAFAKIHSIFLEFGQSLDESGGVLFSLKASHRLVQPVDGFVPLLTSPDGTQLSHGQEVYRNSFAELATLAFGAWTASEKYGDVDLAYQFQVESFSLNKMFTDLPVITSPSPSGTVPENFEVHWKYKNGSTPSSRGQGPVETENYSLLGADFVGPFPGVYAVSITGQLTGPGPGSVSVRLGTRTSLLAPTLIGVAPIPADDFLFSSQFFSYADATYKVVPEPNALLLVVLGATCIFATRRR